MTETLKVKELELQLELERIKAEAKKKDQADREEKARLKAEAAKMHQEQKLADKIQKEKAKEQKAQHATERLQEIMGLVDDIVSSRDMYFVESQDKHYTYVIRNVGDLKYGEWIISKPSAFRTANPILLGRDEWSIFLDVLKDMGRHKLTTTKSLKDSVPEDTLNEWRPDSLLPPSEGEVHWGFDCLMKSLGGIEPNGADHIEEVIGWKYKNLGEFQLPTICWHGEGGSGKGIFVDFVLKTIFGGGYVNTSSIKTIAGTYQDSIIHKLVVLIDEKPGDDRNWETLARYMGNSTYDANRKYGGFTPSIENWNLWFISTNSEQPLRIDSDAEQFRRFSIIRVADPLWKVIADKEGLPTATDDDRSAITSELINGDLMKNVFSNPNEVSKWLNRCIKKAEAKGTMPARLHGVSYQELLNKNRNSEQDVFEEVFLHPDFSHITARDLHDLYKSRQDDDNPDGADLKIASLTHRAKLWLEKQKGTNITYEQKVAVRLPLAMGSDKKMIKQDTVFTTKGRAPVDSTSDYYRKELHLQMSALPTLAKAA